jgi:hypothetical protein
MSRPGLSFGTRCTGFWDLADLGSLQGIHVVALATCGLMRLELIFSVRLLSATKSSTFLEVYRARLDYGRGHEATIS